MALAARAAQLFKGVVWFSVLGVVVERALKARVSSGVWWHALLVEIFSFRASEMPFPIFAWGNGHKSEHEKTIPL